MTEPSAYGARGASPKYQQVTDDLERRIREGGFAVGDPLPKQEQLMRRYRCGRVTIRRALELLRERGLLDEARPGRSPRVVAATDAGLTLRDHVARAFAARHVRMDVWALTVEKLSTAVLAEVDEIRRRGGDGHRPETVTFRVLLPDLTTRHPYPRHVADLDDPRPLEGLRAVIANYAGILQHALVSLKDDGLVRDVRVEFKGLPTVPGEKRYIINGTEILTGYYQIRKITKHDPGDGPSMDLLELYSDDMLFPLHLGPHATAVERAHFEQIRQWFDTRWDKVAQPL